MCIRDRLNFSSYFGYFSLLAKLLVTISSSSVAQKLSVRAKMILFMPSNVTDTTGLNNISYFSHMKFLPPAKRSDNTFGGCMYVCLSVCNMITFESLDVESWFLIWRYILRGYRSSSYMKVIGSRSRSQNSQEHKKRENPYSRNVKLRSAITPVL